MAGQLPPGDQLALKAWSRQLEAEQGGSERAKLLRRVLAALAAAEYSSVRGQSRVAVQAWSAQPEQRYSAGEGEKKAEEPSLQQEPRPRGMTFVTEPAQLCVEEGNVLETGLGNYLKRKKLTRFLVIGFGTVLAVLIGYDPLATNVPEHGEIMVPAARGDGFVRLRIQRTALATRVIKEVCSVAMVFLMLHNMNKDLFFRALQTFDVLIIAGSFLVTNVIWFYNMFQCWGEYYDAEWFVFDILDTLLTVVPGCIVIATMDCWRVATSVDGDNLGLVKLLCATLACATFAQEHAGTVLTSQTTMWSQEPACIGLLCSYPREMFASAELQKVIFLGKLVLKNALGWPFAFIRPRYCRSDAGSSCGLISALSSALKRCIGSAAKSPVSKASQEAETSTPSEVRC